MPKTQYKKGDKKVLRAWAFYDWANSVYALVISTAIFPLYFGSLFEDNQYVEVFGINYKNTALIQHTTTLVFICLAILIPILSGIADYKKNKVSFLKFFCYLGSLCCIGLYFFTIENIYLGLFFYFFALFSFWASLVFYNSYLPEIAFPHQQDRISAVGYSYGYVGSVLLLLINLMMVLFPSTFGFQDTIEPMKISFVMVGLWWAGLANILFIIYQKPNSISQKIFKEVDIVWWILSTQKCMETVKKQESIKKFLIAFFVFSCALQTIILIATYFGEQEIIWKEGEKQIGLIICTLLIQLIAILGAMLTAKLSEKIGNIQTLIYLNIFWFMLCVGGYFIKYSYEFYVVASLVGLVMGGIQALSRSTYSKLIPATENTCSYFSFYQMCMIISISLGTFMSGIVDQLTGSLRNSIIIFAVIFIFGAILLKDIKMKKL